MEPALNKETEFAFRSIHDFFDLYHLHSAIAELEYIINTAGGQKAGKIDEPYDVLFLIKHLKKLSKAAYLININFYKKDKAILSGGLKNPDIENQKHFINRSIYVSAWQCVPRTLSAEEYFNPYKALKKFAESFTNKEWKKAFKSLVRYALMNESIDSYEGYDSGDVLKIRNRLLSLLEGCHLIEVRTYKKNK